MKVFKLFKCILVYIFIAFPAYICAIFMKIKHRDLWLIIECGRYARDNGYWFFKYLREKYPNQETVFVIRKESVDFNKVSSLGKTCTYQSFGHWLYYFICTKEITSDPFSKPGYYISKNLWKNKTYFLQHGVIRDFLTCYTSKNMKFKLFVTSANPEYNFVKENFGFSNQVVKLLGLPRHDNLIKNIVNYDQILIMPTWRKYLIKMTDSEFIESKYFKSWNGLINNKHFIDLLEKYNKNVIFYIHRGLKQYINLFTSSSERIKCVCAETSDVQTLLKTSALLITDYSSVFFDFAYMKKPVLWYTFDNDEYHEGHWHKGYFNEKENLLGINCNYEKKVLEEIEKNILNNFKLDDIQINNIEKFFPFYDGRCCERIFNVIREVK